jgi:hypothetical protein
MRNGGHILSAGGKALRPISPPNMIIARSIDQILERILKNGH